MTISLSEAAARRIGKVVAESAEAVQGVRLEVLGGGCSGYQYKFGFADAIDVDDDIVVERDGAKLVVDKTSLQLLDGSEVDYGEGLMESGFRIVNPQAASSCGCGSSFSVGDKA
ncbi:MAG: iron-sulfur cluster assembly accessory protein [Alphaproteobacteria bacterium]|nr:iron-sulfur cluster assembly accessory protein [Alphaproteobacteria bacterium]